RITPRRLHDDVRNDVLSYGFDKAPFSSAKIGGATALRVSGGNLARSLVGLFGERLAVWKAIGSGDAAWSIAFVKRFDPQINRTRIAFQRVRFHDTRLPWFEGGRQPVRAGPA